MKLIIVLSSLVLILISATVFSSNAPAIKGWEPINTFAKGSLYKKADNEKITLTSFEDKGYAFGYNSVFKSSQYFAGLKEMREKAYAIGGLKNWKLTKVLEEKKSNRKLVLIFEGEYQRADETKVKMYEKHVFAGTKFYQWQIIGSPKDSELNDAFAMKTLQGDELENIR